MGIFSRFSDIVNANILHMLDKAEDPEKMVRLMIQEMEDTLVEVKSSAAKIISEQKNLERRIDFVKKDEYSWQEKAELAVQHERDDLARSALTEKAKRLQARLELEEQLELSQKSLTALRDDISALENKLNDTKARQKTIIMRQRAVQGQYSIHKQLDALHSGKVLAKFEQHERNLDRLEGVVGAYKLRGQDNALVDEFDKLRRDSAIELELAAIKEKVTAPAVPATAKASAKPSANK